MQHGLYNTNLSYLVQFKFLSQLHIILPSILYPIYFYSILSRKSPKTLSNNAALSGALECINTATLRCLGLQSCNGFRALVPYWPCYYTVIRRGIMLNVDDLETGVVFFLRKGFSRPKRRLCQLAMWWTHDVEFDKICQTREGNSCFFSIHGYTCSFQTIVSCWNYRDLKIRWHHSKIVICFLGNGSPGSNLGVKNMIILYRFTNNLLISSHVCLYTLSKISCSFTLKNQLPKVMESCFVMVKQQRRWTFPLKSSWWKGFQEVAVELHFFLRLPFWISGRKLM